MVIGQQFSQRQLDVRGSQVSELHALWAPKALDPSTHKYALCTLISSKDS